MTNLILIICEALCAFGIIVLLSKLFGKYGIICWVAIATILANILTAKTIRICGIDVTMGTTLFASTFLATDILSEKCGKKDARKAVYMGLLGSICLLIFTQFGIHYIPSEFDYAHDSMVTIFTLSTRITISSIVMYVVANLVDIYLYGILKKKTDGKYMWLRNNVATITCNCLENFLFMFGAFLFVYDVKTILIMAVSTSVIEALLGVADTPFLYLATKVFKEEEVNGNN